jgi:uncharacterized YigZ family protein
VTSRYPIPAAEVRVSEIIDRSRFITTMGPAPTVEAARAFIDRLRAEFGDATHNCWAYVAGPPGSTAYMGLSDDGEPSGTAGKPMLQVLLGSGVGDIVVVVTRYFGGIKLGTGGLVRAYSGGVKAALAELPRSERVERRRITVTLPYRLFEQVQRRLPDYEVQILGTEYAVDVTLHVQLPLEHVAALQHELIELSGGQATIHLEN